MNSYNLKNKKIVFSDAFQAELIEQEDTFELQTNEVLIQTEFSLVSNGSEMGVYKNLEGAITYPLYPGYTAIGKIIEIGETVESDLLGKYVLADIPHQSYGIAKSSDILVIDETDTQKRPDYLFTRIGAVSLPSILDTTIKATEKVLVTGLGIVGLLAAQQAINFGYEVYAVDRNERNRKIFEQLTNQPSYASIEEVPVPEKSIGLLLECTGAESILFDSFSKMRKRSEVYLIGVPWTNYTDELAAALTREIFYNFMSVHSGWEWFMPHESNDFIFDSRMNNLSKIKEWIRTDKLKLDAVYDIFDATDCKQAYQGVAEHSLEKISVVFDWR